MTATAKFSQNMFFVSPESLENCTYTCTFPSFSVTLYCSISNDIRSGNSVNGKCTAYASIPYGSIDSCTYNHRMVYVFIIQISTVLLGKSMDTYLLHAVPKIIVQLLLIIVNGSFDSAT